MKEKIQKFSSVFISIMTKIILIGIIGFILFNIGKSIWKNYLVVQKIDAAKKEISDEESQNKNLKNLIVYYQTDSFKELEARRKLDYKKPGENVFIIPELGHSQFDTDSITNSDKKEEDKSQETANFIKWYHYVIK